MIHLSYFLPFQPHTFRQLFWLGIFLALIVSGVGCRRGQDQDRDNSASPNATDVSNLAATITASPTSTVTMQVTETGEAELTVEATVESTEVMTEAATTESTAIPTPFFLGDRIPTATPALGITLPPTTPTYGAPPFITPVNVTPPFLLTSVAANSTPTSFFASLTPQIPTTQAPSATPQASPTGFVRLPTNTPRATLPPAVRNPVPLLTKQAFGSGDGRGDILVTLMIRPADSFIRQQTGSVAEIPPSGSSWVLVQALVTCTNRNNCITPSMFQLIGGSGNAYPVKGLSISPYLFNLYEGVSSGYVGFIVPNSESQLWMVMTVEGTAYAFSLQ